MECGLPPREEVVIKKGEGEGQGEGHEYRRNKQKKKEKKEKNLCFIHPPLHDTAV